MVLAKIYDQWLCVFKCVNIYALSRAPSAVLFDKLPFFDALSRNCLASEHVC